MNETDIEYLVNALNSHSLALEMHTSAVTRLCSVLEKIFLANGLEGNEIRSFGSLISELADIAAYTNNHISAVTSVIEESSKRYSEASKEMTQAANKNLNASSEMLEASKRNLSASEEMLDAVKRH